MGAKIKIDPEFSQLIPATSAEEDAEFERAVLADGRIFEPLILWEHQNILLDGHRRNRLLTRHPTLTAPKPVVLELESRQEAHDWIIHHQLSKRNVSAEQRRYLIGKLYLDRKPAPGSNQHTAKGGPATVTGPQTALEIAESEGVAEKTVRNAADFAEAVDAVAETAPEVKAAVLDGEVKATTKDLEKLAELPAKKRKRAAKAIVNGEVKSVGAAVKAVSEPAAEEADPDSLESVQADLRDYEKQLRDLARLGRKILGAEGNEVTRPWCSRYSLLTLVQPLQHVARTVLNDLPVGGKPNDPKLHREQVAEQA